MSSSASAGPNRRRAEVPGALPATPPQSPPSPEDGDFVSSCSNNDDNSYNNNNNDNNSYIRNNDNDAAEWAGVGFGLAKIFDRVAIRGRAHVEADIDFDNGRALRTADRSDDVHIYDNDNNNDDNNYDDCRNDDDYGYEDFGNYKEGPYDYGDYFGYDDDAAEDYEHNDDDYY